MTATPSLPTVLRGAAAAALRDVRVALPARVETYDPSTCQVSVQPLVADGAVDETGERFTDRLPVINGVPVVFPGGGGMRITFPIAVGDTVLLVFASSSIDRWLALGGEVDPLDDRRHHIADAIAIPGLVDFAHASPASSSAAVLEGSNVQLGSQSATKAALNTDDTTDFMAALAAAIVALGAGPASAQLAALQTQLQTLPAAAPHVGQPWGVGSSKVKVS